MQESYGIVARIAETVVFGSVVLHNGEYVYDHATFAYKGDNYLITLEEQFLRVYDKHLDCYVKMPIDTRDRTKYMFTKPSKRKADGSYYGNHADTMSKELLNVLLLKPDAMYEYLDATETMTVNHKANWTQPLYEYEIAKANYNRYCGILNRMYDREIIDDEDLAFYEDCRTSDDKEFVRLRIATNNLRCQPCRLRIDDISNLELASVSANSIHNGFVGRICRFVKRNLVSHTAISVDFAKKWSSDVVYDGDINPKLMDALKALPQYEEP